MLRDDYYVLETSERGSFCGAYAIGHYIYILWDDLGDASKKAFLQSVNDFYFKKSEVSEQSKLTIQTFKPIMSSMCNHDIQLVLGLPIIAMIKENNCQEQRGNLKKNLQYSLESFWNQKAGVRDQFLMKLNQDMPAENMYTAENFIQRLRDIESNHMLRKMNSIYTRILGIRDYLSQAANYQYPSSFFSGDQLSVVLGQLEIPCEIFLKDQHSSILITPEAKKEPVVRIISAGWHWESYIPTAMLQTHPRIIEKDDDYKKNQVFASRDTEETIKLIFRKIVAAEGVEALNETDKNRVKNIIEQNGLENGFWGRSTVSDESTNPSDSESNSSSSPTMGHSLSDLMSADDDAGDCKWDKFYGCFSVETNVPAEVSKAMNELNEILKKDTSDEFILRPSGKRVDLDFKKIGKFIPALLPYCQKTDETGKCLYKYQVLSILYNLQSVVDGRSTLVAMGTGTGKTVVMGTVITILRKEGYNLFLFEKSKVLKDQHREKKDYDFIVENESNKKRGKKSFIFDGLPAFIADQKENVQQTGVIVWSTIHELQNLLKSKPTNDVLDVFTQKRSVISVDEIHELLPKKCHNMSLSDFKHPPQDGVKDKQYLMMMHNWYSVNAACCTKDLTLMGFSATPGSAKEQLKLCGHAFGQNFSSLIDSTGSMDSFSSLFSHGSMIAAYMKTIKSFSHLVIDEDKDALSTLEGFSPTNKSITLLEGYENINHLLTYLRMVYFIVVSPKTKKREQTIVNQIMSRIRFVHTIKIALLLIGDFKKFPEKYIDSSDLDSIRTVLFVTEYRERQDGSMNRLISKVKTNYLNDNDLKDDAERSKYRQDKIKYWVDHFRGMGFTIPDEAVGFFKKYNLFNDQVHDNLLGGVHDLLPKTEGHNGSEFNLKVFLTEWMKEAHKQGALSATPFKMDQDVTPNGYGKDKDYKMTIISASSATGLDLVAAGKKVNALLLSVPKQSSEFQQLAGRFHRVCNFGDKLPQMFVLTDKHEKWLTLYDLKSVLKPLKSQMLHRDQSFLVCEINKLLSKVSVKDGEETTFHNLRLSLMRAFKKTDKIENTTIKSLSHSHYKVTKSNTVISGDEMLLSVVNMQGVVSDAVFKKFKETMFRLSVENKDSKEDMERKSYFPDKKNPVITLNTEDHTLIAPVEYRDFIWSYIQFLINGTVDSGKLTERIHKSTYWDKESELISHDFNGMERYCQLSIRALFGDMEDENGILKMLWNLPKQERHIVAQSLCRSPVINFSKLRKKITAEKRSKPPRREKLKRRKRLGITEHENEKELRVKKVKVVDERNTQVPGSISGKEGQHSKMKSGKNRGIRPETTPEENERTKKGNGSSNTTSHDVEKNRTKANGLQGMVDKERVCSEKTSKENEQAKKRKSLSNNALRETQSKKLKIDKLQCIIDNQEDTKALKHSHNVCLSSRDSIYQQYMTYMQNESRTNINQHEGVGIDESTAIGLYQQSLKQFTQDVKAIIQKENGVKVFPILSEDPQKTTNFLSVFFTVVEYSGYMIREIEETQLSCLLQMIKDVHSLSDWDLQGFSREDMKQLQSKNSSKYQENKGGLYQYSLLCAAIEKNNYPVVALLVNGNDQLTADKNAHLKKLILSPNEDGELPLQISFQLIRDKLKSALDERLSEEGAGHTAYLWKQITIYQTLKESEFYSRIQNKCLTSDEAKQLFTVVKTNRKRLQDFNKVMKEKLHEEYKKAQQDLDSGEQGPELLNDPETKIDVLFDLIKIYLQHNPLELFKEMNEVLTSSESNNGFDLSFYLSALSSVSFTPEMIASKQAEALYKTLNDVQDDRFAQFKQAYQDQMPPKENMSRPQSEVKIEGLRPSEYVFKCDYTHQFNSEKLVFEGSNTNVVQLIIPTHVHDKSPSQIVDDLLILFREKNMNDIFHIDIALNAGHDYDQPDTKPKLLETCKEKIALLLQGSNHVVRVHCGEWLIKWRELKKIRLDQWKNSNLEKKLKEFKIIDNDGYVNSDYKSKLEKIDSQYQGSDELLALKDLIKKTGSAYKEMVDMDAFYKDLTLEKQDAFKLKLKDLGKPGIGVVRDYLLNYAVHNAGRKNIKAVINVDSDWKSNTLPIDGLIQSSENSPGLLVKSLCYRGMTDESEESLSQPTHAAFSLDLTVRHALAEQSGDYLGYTSEVATYLNEKLVKEISDIFLKEDQQKPLFGGTDREGMNLVKNLKQWMPHSEVKVEVVDPYQDGKEICVYTNGKRFEIVKSPEKWEDLHSFVQLNRIFSLSQTHADTWKLSQIISWHANCQQAPILHLLQLFDYRTLLVVFDRELCDEKTFYQSVMSYSEEMFALLTDFDEESLSNRIREVQKYMKEEYKKQFLNAGGILNNIKSHKEYLGDGFFRYVSAMKASLEGIASFIENANKNSVLGKWRENSGYSYYGLLSKRQLSKFLTTIIDETKKDGSYQDRKKIHSDTAHLTKNASFLNYIAEVKKAAKEVVQKHKKKNQLLLGCSSTTKIEVLKKIDDLHVWIVGDEKKIHNFLFTDEVNYEDIRGNVSLILKIYNQCKAPLSSKILLLDKANGTHVFNIRILREMNLDLSKISVVGLGSNIKRALEEEVILLVNAREKSLNFIRSVVENWVKGVTEENIGSFSKSFLNILLCKMTEVKCSEQKIKAFYAFLCTHNITTPETIKFVDKYLGNNLLRKKSNTNSRKFSPKAGKSAAKKKGTGSGVIPKRRPYIENRVSEITEKNINSFSEGFLNILLCKMIEVKCSEQKVKAFRDLLRTHGITTSETIKAVDRYLAGFSVKKGRSRKKSSKVSPNRKGGSSEILQKEVDAFNLARNYTSGADKIRTRTHIIEALDNVLKTENSSYKLNNLFRLLVDGLIPVEASKLLSFQRFKSLGEDALVDFQSTVANQGYIFPTMYAVCKRTAMENIVDGLLGLHKIFQNFETWKKNENRWFGWLLYQIISDFQVMLKENSSVSHLIGVYNRYSEDSNWYALKEIATIYYYHSLLAWDGNQYILDKSIEYFNAALESLNKSDVESQKKEFYNDILNCYIIDINHKSSSNLLLDSHLETIKASSYPDVQEIYQKYKAELSFINEPTDSLFSEVDYDKLSQESFDGDIFEEWMKQTP